VSADQIGLWAGFVLTLMVFSYLLGDNLLYRLAIYIFAGLSAGYITVVTLEGAILPWLRATVFSGDAGGIIVGLIPVTFAGLLLLKMFRRYHRLGNLPLGFMVGIGAAVGVVGVVSGSLLPLLRDTAAGLFAAADAPNPAAALANAFVVSLSVICTLVFLGRFGRRQADGTVQRGPLARALSAVGQGVVIIALAAIYSGAILTGLVLLSDRIAFLLITPGGG
jgi:hypothetical protein